MDARAEARSYYRYDDARRASIAARYPDAHDRHDGDRAVLLEPAAPVVLDGMLGWRDVRCRHALSQGGSLETARAVSRAYAEPAPADVATVGERGRLCELSGQCRALLRHARRRARYRRVSDLRLAQLGREHAGVDRGGCGGRE